MDSDALFIISSLTRKLIDNCLNAYAYDKMPGVPTHIKQVFLLTHNAFFYNEVAPSYIPHYETCSFFDVTKVENSSSIHLNVTTIIKDEYNEKSKNTFLKLIRTLASGKPIQKQLTLEFSYQP